MSKRAYRFPHSITASFHLKYIYDHVLARPYPSDPYKAIFVFHPKEDSRVASKRLIIEVGYTTTKVLKSGRMERNNPRERVTLALSPSDQRIKSLTKVVIGRNGMCNLATMGCLYQAFCNCAIGDCTFNDRNF
ncbi:hypothetical protein ACTXT7_016620 [Hymenolepis weldensis]